jgi:hypothetical protein
MWRVAAAVVMLLGSVPARAHEQSAQLVYRGAVCSTAHGAAHLKAQIAELVGRNPFTAEASLVIEVTVEANDGVGSMAGRVRATIFASGALAGTRRLEAAGCAELLDAVAFVISMMLDTPAAARALDSGEAEAPRHIYYDAILGGTTSDRLWPQAYAGVRARLGRLSGGLELAADVPDSFAAGIGRVTVQRAVATLAPCVHHGPVAGCIMLSAGVVRGSGDGYMASASAVLPMAVAGGRLTWEWPITDRLQLHIRGEAGGFLTKNRFLIDDEVVWSAPRIEGRLGIGVVAQFP